MVADGKGGPHMEPPNTCLGGLLRKGKIEQLHWLDARKDVKVDQRELPRKLALVQRVCVIFKA